MHAGVCHLKRSKYKTQSIATSVADTQGRNMTSLLAQSNERCFISNDSDLKLFHNMSMSCEPNI